MKTPLYQADTKDVIVERDAGIVTITLSRPEDQNRLTPDALAKLEVIAGELREDDAVRAVVVTGAGTRDFSMGILPPSLRESLGKENVVAIVRLANRAFDAIDSLPQVVIAGLNGATRGGAAELALACDIRVASDRATLAFPETSEIGSTGAGLGHNGIRERSLPNAGRSLKFADFAGWSGNFSCSLLVQRKQPQQGT